MTACKAACAPQRFAWKRTTRVDPNDLIFFKTRANNFAGMTVLDFCRRCQVDLPPMARGGSGAFN